MQGAQLRPIGAITSIICMYHPDATANRALLWVRHIYTGSLILMNSMGSVSNPCDIGMFLRKKLTFQGFATRLIGVIMLGVEKIAAHCKGPPENKVPHAAIY